MTPLALKRNYLYRITVGRKLEPEFNLEVLDWVNEDAFNVDEIPFQTQMNAKLAINNFATSNVKTLDEGESTVTFVTEDPTHTSGYYTWSDKWSTAVYRNTVDGTYYRVPTKDEAYLLFPDQTNGAKISEVMNGDSEIEETLPDYLFGSKEVNGGAGKSVFKNAASVSPTPVGTRAGGPAYPIVYAIRFKGTAQCAAYRYEVKNFGDETTAEIEIRIKALQPNTLMTIEEVADETYWGNPADGDTDAGNQLIWHLGSAGFKTAEGEPDASYRGTNTLFWTSTNVDEVNARDFGHNPGELVVATYGKAAAGTLLMVKATEDEVQEMRNAALKVNMFTQYNAKEFDVDEKTITSFYDKLTVSLADCPTTSYVSYTELKAAGATTADAIFTGPDGKKYRLPTGGELNLLLPIYTETDARLTVSKDKDGMLHPYWNTNASTNTYPYVMAPTVYTETVYLKNGADGRPDKTTHPEEVDGDYVISGYSQLKVGNVTEVVHRYTEVPDDPEKGNYNIAPVYALRFKGTSQYAAYRWETCKIDSDPTQRYLSIKIKALGKDDSHTSIDMVANEKFWDKGYIEFKFPASGYYKSGVEPDSSQDNITGRGFEAHCWSSTLWDDGSLAQGLHCNLVDAHYRFNVQGLRHPLRFVRVEE